MRLSGHKLNSRSAFTLVEVILAILIIVGILSVVLYFYQQAAEVRQRALEETEFITTSRMFLDQITTELRSARTVDSQFLGLEGSSNWISFVTTAIPHTPRWIIRTNESSATIPVTDLKKIRYSLLVSTNELESEGLQRVEELAAASAVIETNTPSASATNEPPSFVTAGETNAVEGVTNIVQVMARPPLTDLIGYLQFRYWDGIAWVENWSGMELPAGVEITLGREPMPREETIDYPFELYRRVVYLPYSEHPANEIVTEPVEEFTL